jgi:hypothetical protein
MYTGLSAYMRDFIVERKLPAVPGGDYLLFDQHIEAGSLLGAAMSLRFHTGWFNSYSSKI